MPKKSQAIQKKADTLFSKIVRARDGACRRCGKQETLQCHHLISRTYRKVRFDERNGVAVCVGCHLFLTHRPLDNEDLAVKLLGESGWAELKTIARNVDYRVDLKEVFASLQARWNEIEQAA